ncbi:hypothetical protein AJ78_03699 [Emergomyces pasteurianus Ep9510]|uniref:Uncharacterized protein n=1 Tax=Emergomyces pasteurianus Ep9510 TaxID=1447872 RepID=A0A1J9QIW0_9EURO|nr:hypothetical protein AJ78_03699 [Emergomyces pasteurianus Ep9510]
MSVSEVKSTLFVFHANSIVAGSESLCEEQASLDEDTDFSSASLNVSLNENLQPVSNSELVIGLSTLSSDSPSPATQILKKNNHDRLGSKQSKIIKITHTDMKKSLTKHSQVGKQLESVELKKSSVMTSLSLAMNALCRLSDSDLQRALEFLIFLYHNQVLSSQLSPRALVTCEKDDHSDKDAQVEEKLIKIHVTLSRLLEVKAGQYVNLWMLSTRCGLTAKLQARAIMNESAFFSAFVSDPHGLSEPVSQYETVLAIVNDFGIAGVLFYLKQLLHGYNTFTSSIRRVHLVWQVKTLNITIAAQPLLNSLLINDVLNNDYILEMSFYMESSIKVEDEKSFRKHKRAMLYHHQLNYREIISSEVSGDYIPRLPNIHEERGRLLVMVSVSDELRDRLQEIVRSYLHEKVEMCEVKFQPG